MLSAAQEQALNTKSVRKTYHKDVKGGTSIKVWVYHWKWYACIQVDRQIEHRRPDIVVMEKITKKCLIIDVACPVDNNLILEEKEKLGNYSELQFEMWDKETLIVPIIIGPLGSIPNVLECNLKKWVIPYNVEILQKSVLLGTANIVTKVLSIKQ